MSADPGDAEIAARLAAGLARLPRRQREIYLAIRIDNLSYAEIAARTGLDPAEVQRQFAASLRALLAALDAPAPWWRRLARRLAAAFPR